MQRFWTFTRLLTTAAPAPLATVSVKLHGTDTLASLFSDNAVTPMANPFTATADGYAACYAENGRYDITITPDPDNPATGIDDDPYTLEDVLLFDPED